MHKTRPVTFNIPAGQPIETTSISSFKGIQYSDNPLNVDPDSASDMLNVYLNDSGTLTTRPRIEFEDNYFDGEHRIKSGANIYYISEVLGSYENIINKIKLKDNLSLVQMQNTENTSVIFVEEISENSIIRHLVTLRSEDTNGFTLTKMSAFIKNDIIYIINGENYYNIKKEQYPSTGEIYVATLVTEDENSYTPTISIEGKKVNETENILNRYYYRKLYWDDREDLSSYINKTGYVSSENKYFIENTHDTNIDPEYLVWPMILSDGRWAVFQWTESGVNLHFVSQKEKSIETTSKNNILSTSDNLLAISKNGNFILYQETVEIDEYSVSYGNIKIKSTTDDAFDEVLIENNNEIRATSDYCAINNSGNVFLIGGDFSGTDRVKFYSGVLDASTNRYSLSEITTVDLYFSESNDATSVFVNSDGDTFSMFRKIDDVAYYDVFKSLDVDSASYSKKTVSGFHKYTAASPSLSYYIADENLLFYVYDSARNTTESYNNRTNAAAESIVDDMSDFVIDDAENIFVSRKSGLYQLNKNSYFKVLDYSNLQTNTYQINSENLSLFDSYRNPEDSTSFSAVVYYNDLTPNFIVKYESEEFYKDVLGFDNYTRFQNNYWFYGNSNRLYYTSLNDPTYIEKNNYIDVGDDSRITGLAVLSDNLLACYKENELFLITRVYLGDELGYGYIITETKGDIGNIPIGQNITTKYSELPLSFDNSGIFTISQVENVTLSEHTTASLSSNIDKIFLAEPNKETILTHNHRYWTYVIFPGETSKVYVLDNRTNEWYYWELPHSKIVSLWEEDEIGSDDLLYITTKYITEDGSVYALRTVDSVVQIDYINSNDYYTEYSDTFENQKEEIKWFWQSQILPLTFSKYSKSYPALGYRKQLIQTGFLFTDTDESEEYSLQYKFNVFRKNLSSVGERSISGTLNRVRSILKRTYIPRLNFLQIRIENSETDFVPQTNLPNTHNKLNLIQLKFKYKLMEEGV